MGRNGPSGFRKRLLWSCAAVLAAAGAGRGDEMADLKAQVAAQQKQIEELRKLVERNAVRPAAAETDKPEKADKPAAKDGEKEVQKIVESYLKDHPGAGMPPGVQTGWETGRGFVIRSPNDPDYVKWEDDSRIPFELRIRGRIQSVYDFYKVTDSRNHLTGVDTGNNTSGDFSQLEIKRMRLIFEGNAFDPDLRYHIQFDGNTRGLTGLAGGGIGTNTGVTSTGGVPGGNSFDTVDHAVRLFSAYVAYDFHPCASFLGCGADCPEGTYRYQPTVTAIFGKFKPFMSYEEYLGSANEQFVEYAMSEWYFDADDDNYLMGAGTQVKAFDDRLYMMAIVTNGNETQIGNLQMDRLPGFNAGFWWDFGGNWNPARNRWDLYGDSVSDIDYSCNPVVRVGGALNLVPMDRRDVYTDAELNRVRVVSPAPGGTTLVGLLNGGGVNANAAGVGQFAVDAFDSYTFEAFASAHWRGASVLLDTWVQNIDNIRGRRFQASGAQTGLYPGNGKNQPILYTGNLANGSTFTALFPSDQGLVNYGFNLQGGYFLIPKKLEVAARWSNIRGDSGAINGDGTRTALSAADKKALGLGAVPGTIFRVGHAFDHEEGANEYAIGINYYFKRQQVKWQTDLSFYNGGNPATGGQSPAGFIPGVDGYLVRTQIQLFF